MNQIIHQYQWFVTAALVIILMFMADHLLNISPIRFLEALAREFRELAARQWTTGAVNAAGLLVVFVFGLVLLASNDAGDLKSWLTGIMDRSRAQEYAASVSATTLFIGLIALAALSTFLTLLRDIWGP